MGQKDLTEKNLEFYADVFADTINALLYNGRPLVEPQSLLPAPTETLYPGRPGTLRSQFHDVSKYAQQEGIIQIQYTLENETKGSRRMVLRKAGYAGAVYREQTDRPDSFPLIGLVLYWGRRRWNYPRSMVEIFASSQIPAESWKYIDNCQIQVFEMARLPAEIRGHFSSDMRIVVDYLAEGENYKPSEQAIVHPEAFLLLMKNLTGDIRWLDLAQELIETEEKGGRITMCELIDRYEKRGISIGIRIGRSEGIIQLLEELGAVPEKLKKKIMGQDNSEVLKRWNLLAAHSKSLEEFERQMDVDSY